MSMESGHSTESIVQQGVEVEKRSATITVSISEDDGEVDIEMHTDPPTEGWAIHTLITTLAAGVLEGFDLVEGIPAEPSLVA